MMGAWGRSAKKSDAAFRIWTQKQPSCITGKYSEYVGGEGMNIAAHVRRASKAGTGYKPMYSVIPLTDAEHQTQSRHGELVCLQVWRPDLDIETVEQAKEYFDGLLLKHYHKWLKHI